MIAVSEFRERYDVNIVVVMEGEDEVLPGNVDAGYLRCRNRGGIHKRVHGFIVDGDGWEVGHYG